MIKKFIIKISILFITVMFMDVCVCKADPGDSLNVPIVEPIPGGNIINPNTGCSSHYAVIGLLDDTALTLYVSSEVMIAYVRFYRNGLLVVTDDTPIPINNSLYYDLSSFGSGAYTVQLNAYDGTVYIGNFTL